MEAAPLQFYLQLEGDVVGQPTTRLVLRAQSYPQLTYLVMHVEARDRMGVWHRIDLQSEFRIRGEGLTGVILGAIAKHEMVGKSATEGLHAVFWRLVVQSDRGIKYLLKHAPDAGSFYLMMRSNALTHGYPAVEATREAIMGIYHAGKLVPTVEQRWALLRTCERLIEDQELSDAVCAVLDMKDDDATKTAHVLRLVDHSSPLITETA